MDKPFLSDFDNNILSRMYPDGKIVSLKKEEKPKKKKANKKPLKIEKELRDENWKAFVGGLRP